MSNAKFDLEQYLRIHIQWSKKTFGQGKRIEQLCAHLHEEIEEVRAEPNDLHEWIDVVLLAMDGAWRSGYSTEQIIQGLLDKQKINFERNWEKADKTGLIKHVNKKRLPISTKENKQPIHY